MKTFTITAVSVLFFLVCGVGQIFAAPNGLPGNVRVLKVRGDVHHAKSMVPLKEGDFVQEKQVIKTGKDSVVFLLMSNGTLVRLAPNSSLSIDKFSQVPFDSSVVNYKDLKAEPSISQTKLSVTEGSFIADICKLNKASTFQIATPAGVAGIRGTIIRVTITRSGGGAPTSVVVDMPEGTSDFAAVDGQTLTLSDGTTITFNLDGNTLTAGDITPLSPPVDTEIRALLNEALAQIPQINAFEGTPDGSPESGNGTPDGAGGFGGDQGTGNAGTAPFGGNGGGGSGSSPTTTSPSS